MTIKLLANYELISFCDNRYSFVAEIESLFESKIIFDSNYRELELGAYERGLFFFRRDFNQID